MKSVSSLRTGLLGALIAGLLNPVSWATQPWLAAGVSLGLVL